MRLAWVSNDGRKMEDFRVLKYDYDNVDKMVLRSLNSVWCQGGCASFSTNVASKSSSSPRYDGEEKGIL